MEWISGKNSYLIKKREGKMIIDKFCVLIISVKLLSEKNYNINLVR